MHLRNLHILLITNTFVLAFVFLMTKLLHTILLWYKNDITVLTNKGQVRTNVRCINHDLHWNEAPGSTISRPTTLRLKSAPKVYRACKCALEGRHHAHFCQGIVTGAVLFYFFQYVHCPVHHILHSDRATFTNYLGFSRIKKNIIGQSLFNLKSRQAIMCWVCIEDLLAGTNFYVC